MGLGVDVTAGLIRIADAAVSHLDLRPMGCVD